METTRRKAFGIGELRIGWSSWNEKEQSVKWAYPDKRGSTSIRSPEVPLDILVELLVFALDEGILSLEQQHKIKNTLMK
ncbi:hypothetical protein DXT76_10725, partial [Halobacillus trueperi]